jgi:hypothetical protein
MLINFFNKVGKKGYGKRVIWLTMNLNVTWKKWSKNYIMYVDSRCAPKMRKMWRLPQLCIFCNVLGHYKDACWHKPKEQKEWHGVIFKNDM